MGRLLLNIIVLFVVAGIAGCADGHRVTLSECSDGSCGDVRLVVYGSKSPAALSPHGKVKVYRVSITGPGLEGRLMADFPGDADEGVIENIPAGDDRLIVVQALNGQDLKIREGETDGVRIPGGSMAEVDVVLEAVPIFVNLRDGAIIENTRLIFQIYSESSVPAVIEDVFDEASRVLADASTNVPEISVDRATGLGRMAPSVLDPGTHTFTVSDAATGRSNVVSVRLLDGSTRKPAPLLAGSDVGVDPSFPLRRLGQALDGQTLGGALCCVDVVGQ